MQQLQDLIISKKERIKVKLSSDERVWFVKVEQSLTAKRYNKVKNCSVESLKNIINNYDHRTLEINQEVLEEIKKRDTRHIRILMETLRSYHLVA